MSENYNKENMLCLFTENDWQVWESIASRNIDKKSKPLTWRQALMVFYEIERKYKVVDTEMLAQKCECVDIDVVRRMVQYLRRLKLVMTDPESKGVVKRYRLTGKGRYMCENLPQLT